jgi:hypothetical protein
MGWKGKGAWGLAGTAAAAGLGYLGYNYFSKPKTMYDHMGEYAQVAQRKAKEWAPMLRQAAGHMGYSAGPTGNYSQMGYQAGPTGNYSQMGYQANPYGQYRPM